MMTVLITGVSSGIGNAAKELFLQQGHRVIGVDKAFPPVPESHSSRRFLFFRADILDASALQDIFEHLHDHGIVLDAVVNIAGMHAIASMIESDPERVRQMYRVNVEGPLLVNRIFYPLLASKGRVLIVTSEVAGLDPLPFNGAYTVSKTALASYAQALRQELFLRGQKVVEIKPGAIRTPLAAGSITGLAAYAASTKLFCKEAGRFVRIAKAFMGTPLEAEKAAALIVRAAAVRHPRTTYTLHRNPGLLLLGLLPKKMQCLVVKLLLG